MLTVSPVRWNPSRLGFWLKVCLATALLTALFFGNKVFGQGKPLSSEADRSESAAVSIAQSLLQHYNLMTPHSFLPYILAARFGRTIDQPSFVETMSYVRSCPRRASSFFFLRETPRSDRAAIQTECRLLYPVLRRESQDKAMCDSMPNLRPSASACVASTGTPGVSNIDGLLAEGRLGLDRGIFATEHQSGSFILVGEGGEPPSSGHPNPFFG